MVEVYPVYLFIVTLFGLCLGSFATALAHRLPRGESIIATGKKPTRSRCPSCGAGLKIPDLVPVFSWLFSGGKCRACKAPIGVRYPLIELATMGLCLLFFLRFGMIWPVLVLILLAPVLVALVVIDLDFTILPDRLNLAVFLGGVAVLALAAPDRLLPAVTGAIVYGLFSFLLRAVFMKIMKRDPLGLGDVKFFAAAGFWLGLESFPAFLMISGVAGVGLSIIWKKMTGEREFPFGPALILAFIWCLVDTGGVLLTPDPGYWQNFL